MGRMPSYITGPFTVIVPFTTAAATLQEQGKKDDRLYHLK